MIKEETEVKKDIEWLKGRFRGRKIFKPQNDREIGYNMAIDEFSEYVNQLDEPEVLTDKWIDDNSVYASSDGVTEEYVHVDDLQNLLVPKPELPVIPKFVAEWIEEVKPDNSLRLAFAYIAQQKRDNYDDELAFWLEEGNSESFARAWLDGYTEEEEQKYYIRDQHGVYLLAKNHRDQGKVQTVAEIVEYYGVEEIELDYELTEQEIKDYDTRYWAFRKPVEELEE